MCMAGTGLSQRSTPAAQPVVVHLIGRLPTRSLLPLKAQLASDRRHVGKRRLGASGNSMAIPQRAPRRPGRPAADSLLRPAASRHGNIAVTEKRPAWRAGADGWPRQRKTPGAKAPGHPGREGTRPAAGTRPGRRSSPGSSATSRRHAAWRAPPAPGRSRVAANRICPQLPARHAGKQPSRRHALTSQRCHARPAGNTPGRPASAGQAVPARPAVRAITPVPFPHDFPESGSSHSNMCSSPPSGTVKPHNGPLCGMQRRHPDAGLRVCQATGGFFASFRRGALWARVSLLS